MHFCLIIRQTTTCKGATTSGSFHLHLAHADFIFSGDFPSQFCIFNPAENKLCEALAGLSEGPPSAAAAAAAANKWVEMGETERD